MEAENAVIGIASMNEEIIDKVRDRIPKPYYLNSIKNRILLKAIYELDEDGKGISPVTVGEHLEGEQLQKLGGVKGIINKLETYGQGDLQQLETCLDQVVEDFVEREGRRLLLRSEQKIDEGENTLAVFEWLDSKLESLQSELSSSDIDHVGSGFNELIDFLEETEKNGRPAGSISTGISDLDDRINYICPQDYLIISADTKKGKTSLALQIADTAVDGQGRNAFIFSGEMTRREILMKIASKRGIADLNEMQNGELSQDQWDRLVNMQSQLSEQGFYTIRSQQPTIYDFLNAVRKADAEYGVDLAVLDYLQDLQNPSPVKMEQHEFLSQASSKIKDFSTQEEIPIIAISRENKNGTDFGTSGAKYDCNYRIQIKDAEPKKDEYTKAVLKIPYARFGRGGSVSMIFEGQYSRFIQPSSEVNY